MEAAMHPETTLVSPRYDGLLADMPTTDLVTQLHAACRAGRCAWPGVELAEDDFARHVEALLPAGTSVVPPHAEDLYLACACARGNARAISFFSARFLADVPVAVARISTDSTFVEELVQSLRETMLVGGPSAAPRIAEYRGTGPLGGWVRVSAVRAALRMKEQQRRATPDANIEAKAMATTLGPELDYLKRRYRPAVEEALREALASLDDEARSVLRAHFVEGLSIDAIGARHGVHRATAARWIVAGRRALLEATRARAAARLRIPDSDVDSLMQLVASQLELSIRRLSDG
jgi:RNA polymerase sigma-70 factor (ECF subfamily)